MITKHHAGLTSTLLSSGARRCSFAHSAAGGTPHSGDGFPAPTGRCRLKQSPTWQKQEREEASVGQVSQGRQRHGMKKWDKTGIWRP